MCKRSKTGTLVLATLGLFFVAATDAAAVTLIMGNHLVATNATPVVELFATFDSTDTANFGGFYLNVKVGDGGPMLGGADTMPPIIGVQVAGDPALGWLLDASVMGGYTVNSSLSSTGSALFARVSASYNDSAMYSAVTPGTYKVAELTFDTDGWTGTISLSSGELSIPGMGTTQTEFLTNDTTLGVFVPTIVDGSLFTTAPGAEVPEPGHALTIASIGALLLVLRRRCC